MRCDPWASFLAHNLASPCFGPKPKARVVVVEAYGVEAQNEHLILTPKWMKKLKE